MAHSSTFMVIGRKIQRIREFCHCTNRITQYDDEFLKLHLKIEALMHAYRGIYDCLKQYLQSHQESSLSLMVRVVNKRVSQYEESPHACLANQFMLFGRTFPDGSPFGSSVMECSKSLHQIGVQETYLAEFLIRNLIEPVKEFVEQCGTFRSKCIAIEQLRLELDFCLGYYKQKDDAAVLLAREKYEAELVSAKNFMQQLISRDVDNVNIIKDFVTIELGYHQTCVDVFHNLQLKLEAHDDDPPSIV